MTLQYVTHMGAHYISVVTIVTEIYTKYLALDLTSSCCHGDSIVVPINASLPDQCNSIVQ